MRDSPPVPVVALMEASVVTGPAKNLLEFARRARPVISLSIVTFQRDSGNSPTDFQRAASRAGIPVDVIFERRRFDTAVVPQIREALERRSAAVLQTHHVKSHFLARAFGLAQGRPWIAFHHGYTSINRKDRAYNLLDRWSLRAASRVVTVCEPFAGQLRRDCGVVRERLHVQHNAVQPFVPPPDAELQRVREALSLDASRKIILSAGRLSREKGHDLLLQSLARVPASRRGFVCVIAGDGPERTALRRQAAALGLDQQVRFAGHVPSLAPLFALADLLILPSRSEGSPNVLLEAMAAGVPAVAASVGGVPEIATHRETALLFQVGDCDAMAGLTEELLNDPALGRRLGSAAREMASARFSPDAYCRKLLDLYSAVLA